MFDYFKSDWVKRKTDIFSLYERMNKTISVISYSDIKSKFKELGSYLLLEIGNFLANDIIKKQVKTVTFDDKTMFSYQTCVSKETSLTKTTNETSHYSNKELFGCDFNEKSNEREKEEIIKKTEATFINNIFNEKSKMETLVDIAFVSILCIYVFRFSIIQKLTSSIINQLT